MWYVYRIIINRYMCIAVIKFHVSGIIFNRERIKGVFVCGFAFIAVIYFSQQYFNCEMIMLFLNSLLLPLLFICNVSWMNKRERIKKPRDDLRIVYESKGDELAKRGAITLHGNHENWYTARGRHRREFLLKKD